MAKPDLLLQIDPTKWKKRGGGAKTGVRNKEMLLMRASKLRELPKSTLKARFKNKEQNTEKLVSIRSYSKLVLS